MNIYLQIIFLFMFSISYSQAQNAPDDRLGRLDWIADQWVYADSQGVIRETWVKEADDSFTGEAVTVKNGLVVFTEQLKIEKIGDDIFYTATVEHNPGPVSFKLIELVRNRAVFENPEHDFPNRIIYELKNSDSLYARVEGKDKEGKMAFSEFFYTRAR